MPPKTNVQSSVQQIDQLQGAGSAPIPVDNTATGIVVRPGRADAGEWVESIIVANPTVGSLTSILYMLPIPTGTPTLTDAMKVAFSGSVGAGVSAQMLTRPLWLPAGYQLRAVASGAGPLNFTPSSRADELV